MTMIGVSMLEQRLKKNPEYASHASTAERILGPADAATPPRMTAAAPMVEEGRRGGQKSAINRPSPAESAARRKAALDTLRFAFAVDITHDDPPSPRALVRATDPGQDG